MRLKWPERWKCQCEYYVEQIVGDNPKCKMHYIPREFNPSLDLRLARKAGLA